MYCPLWLFFFFYPLWHSLYSSSHPQKIGLSIRHPSSPASLRGVEFYRRWLPIGKLKCVRKDARVSMKAREAVWLARGPQTMSAFSSSWPLVTLTERWQPCELGSPQRREAGRGCGEDRNRQEERSEQQRSNDRAMTVINSILRTAV